MRKKLIAILAVVVMLASLFLFVGCDEPNVSDSGNNENDGMQNGEIIAGKEDGEIVDGEEEKEIFDFALGTLSEEDFRLTVTLDKESYQVGDQITATVKLTNLSGKDIFVEIPDWIAMAMVGGKTMEDTIEFRCVAKSNSAIWLVPSIAVISRPRTVFRKDETIEKMFTYNVSEKEDLISQVHVAFYFGGEEESRFSKQIVLNNEFEVVIAEE